MRIRSTKPVANDSGQYLFAAENIKKYSPANVGMAHSNQLYFLEHSEEPYNKYIYCICLCVFVCMGVCVCVFVCVCVSVCLCVTIVSIVCLTVCVYVWCVCVCDRPADGLDAVITHAQYANTWS